MEHDQMKHARAFSSSQHNRGVLISLLSDEMVGNVSRCNSGPVFRRSAFVADHRNHKFHETCLNKRGLMVMPSGRISFRLPRMTTSQQECASSGPQVGAHGFDGVTASSTIVVGCGRFCWTDY